MASTYPTALDTWATNKQDDTDAASGSDLGLSTSVGDHATHHNDLADSINKIEAELGTNPSGAQSTLKSRIAVTQEAPLNAVSWSDTAANNLVAGASQAANTTAWTAIMAAMPDWQGGEILIPRGTYKGTISTGKSVRLIGQGSESTILECDTGDLIAHPTSVYYGGAEAITLRANPGAGHIYAPAAGVAMSRWLNMRCYQTNPAKSIWNQPNTGYYVDNSWKDCELEASGAYGTATKNGTTGLTSLVTGAGVFRVGQAIVGTGIPVDTTITAVDHGAGTITMSAAASGSGSIPISGQPTVPAFKWTSTTSIINRNVFEDLRCYYSGNFFFWLEHSGAGDWDSENVWSRINFEITNGGNIKLFGCHNCEIINCATYDLVGPTVRDMYWLGESGAGLNCRNCTLRTCYPRGTTLGSGLKDIKISDAWYTTIENCGGTIDLAGSSDVTLLAVPDTATVENYVGKVMQLSPHLVRIGTGHLQFGGTTDTATPANGSVFRNTADDRLTYKDSSGGITAMEGRGFRAPVRVAAPIDVTVASPGTTIDGVTMSAGPPKDRVLLVAQTTVTQNGIYDFNGSAVPMTRSADSDSAAKLTDSLLATVDEGTVNKDSIWSLSTNKPITVGTTPLRFTRVHPSYEQSSHPVGQAYQPTSSKLENLPRDTIDLQNQAALTTQIVRVFPAGVLRAGDTLAAINLQVATTASASITNSWGGIARLSDRVVLAISATSTATTAANTLKTFTFTSAFTADKDETLIGFVMYQATTVPSLFGINHGNVSIISQAPVINGTSNTGATTPVAVGATLTAFTADTEMIYAFFT